ncbi:uncharacterized protein E0L32_009913 [Thyridium curvatum]|uniref:EF-hand domain-containing protein n=1 Tax=Thyridium curvatum TaxID=1093900 RepID=A0A507AQ08_9PEZI|nr:uncharacterized protein E0L32_009913 [Thyridium curvatum]TPX08574.1 hypothetical protein E0L32_009913 [Thyridium curvatum]
MKTSTFCALVLAIVPLAAACCKQDKLTSCCGKGKCNIFCCNCKGGCKSKEDCKGMDLPICWGVGSPTRPVVICTKDSKTGVLRDASDETTLTADFFENMDADTEAAGLASLTAAGFSGPEGDERIFSEVDKDGKGHFTYEEFLTFVGAKDDEEYQAYFAKSVTSISLLFPFLLHADTNLFLYLRRFDRNSDGVITVDEMREPVDDADSPVQQGPRQSGRPHQEL